MGQKEPLRDETIEPGETVYDSDDRVLGRVTGFTERGFEVEPVDRDDAESEELPGKEFGEGYLMWRCTECGEMGDLEHGMPGSCPSCGAPEEAVTAVRED